ncbi:MULTISPECIES: efflux RND transporter periplasmic adaptor subunit [unclassified Flavobacterium]|jgi:Cu(I)/Ag(I) efflux system membrane fusion protein|uniref:efflux RND transporter periplasmic adaptor subunit n=1 Tax=unclassified Flavobacterium TaxID=196869 RepID=UPI0025BB4A4E|nr:MULTISPECIES: efflux RND transporter periplasmic adaptor subunit [unclassified Flavobacterium]
MNKYLKYSLLVIVISIFGFTAYFYTIKSENHSESSVQKEVYTCSMHPQIIKDKPGSCPICGMTLVKKVIKNQVIDSKSIEDLLKPTDNYIVGNYQTTIAKDTTLSAAINLPGLVTYDPNSSVNVAARISGKIERMYVNYKFQKVNKGQKLFDLYSPELLTEQQNFIYLISNDAENTSIIKASKQKLLLYGMTSNQINSLASTKKANPVISIYSPASGIVSGTESMSNNVNATMQNPSSTTENLSVKEGDYIKKNQVVFKLLNTDKVWGIFNVIQGYNSLIKTNQPIRITTELDENETFNAQINFIETQFNPADKTNRIRVYLNNNTLKLPIGLRLQGVVKTNPTKGIWIQKQAMVSIGTKKIVFLKMGNGFKATAVKTGIEINDFVQIIDGILVQDTIAENGHYLIDSESFIKTE